MLSEAKHLALREPLTMLTGARPFPVLSMTGEGAAGLGAVEVVIGAFN